MPAKSKKDPVQQDQAQEDGALVAAAKMIGKTAGKIAALAGAATPTAPRAQKKGKLPKKNKSRLPRRQKKALKKTPSAA